MTLEDVLHVSELIVVPLVIAVGAWVDRRMRRIERSVERLADNTVTPELCRERHTHLARQVEGWTGRMEKMLNGGSVDALRGDVRELQVRIKVLEGRETQP